MPIPWPPRTDLVNSSSTCCVVSQAKKQLASGAAENGRWVKPKNDSYIVDGPYKMDTSIKEPLLS